MKALESKEHYNSSSTGVFAVLFAVILASIIIGSTVTGVVVVASPIDPTNSTVTNQTEAGQISSKHDTSMNAIRNMK